MQLTFISCPHHGQMWVLPSMKSFGDLGSSHLETFLQLRRETTFFLTFSAGNWHKSFPEIFRCQQFNPVPTPKWEEFWEVHLLCPGGKRMNFSEHTAVSATRQPVVPCPPPPSSSMLTSFRKATAPNPTSLQHLAQSPGCLGCIILSVRSGRGSSWSHALWKTLCPLFSTCSSFILWESSLPSILHEHP